MQFKCKNSRYYWIKSNCSPCIALKQSQLQSIKKEEEEEEAYVKTCDTNYSAVLPSFLFFCSQRLSILRSVESDIKPNQNPSLPTQLRKILCRIRTKKPSKRYQKLNLQTNTKNQNTSTITKWSIKRETKRRRKQERRVELTPLGNGGHGSHCSEGSRRSHVFPGLCS